MQASPYPMVSVDDAIAAVLSRATVLAPEDVGVDDALGRVLAETVTAADDMPPFVASAVDGYAVIAADGLAPRRVLSEIIAGATSAPAVEPGTAVRIMTG